MNILKKASLYECPILVGEDDLSIRVGNLVVAPMLVVCFVLIIAFGGYARGVVATEWSITTKFDQRFVVDDNTRFQSGSSSTTYGFTTLPETQYRYRSPVLDINVFGAGGFSRFNDSTLDSEELTVRSVSSYTTERSIWALNANFQPRSHHQVPNPY